MGSLKMDWWASCSTLSNLDGWLDRHGGALLQRPHTKPITARLSIEKIWLEHRISDFGDVGVTSLSDQHHVSGIIFDQE
jgi:hypothetical protein